MGQEGRFYKADMKKIKDLTKFLTPSGAGIAIICFFLPWVRVSCGTVTVEASGARIGGIFWAVLGVSIIMLLSFFYFWKKRDMVTMRLVALIGGLFSLMVMIYRFIDAFGGDASNIKISDVGATVRYGAWGEFFGFILAMLGTVFMVEDRKAPNAGSAETGSKPNLAARHKFPYLLGRKPDDDAIPHLSESDNQLQKQDEN
ncbi:membrane hypothetical protein [Candidatus Zixiibacteriota bacterium]|nr:membrane hypothetical protein [candidate division Zixibacteria bacterium]